jgi:uncharacterized protein (DUF4415 family)
MEYALKMPPLFSVIHCMSVRWTLQAHTKNDGALMGWWKVPRLSWSRTRIAMMRGLKLFGSFQRGGRHVRKGNIMNEKMVSYNADALPPRTAADRMRLTALAAQPDSTIDLSDIPELTEEDWKNAVRGKHYRPVKAQITASLDKDVLAWLKADGRGYQTRMNAILRREMLQARGVQK